jgi:hypothetical protein
MEHIPDDPAGDELYYLGKGLGFSCSETSSQYEIDYHSPSTSFIA